MSRVWLWETQNAFLTETDPSTGSRWKDRHGKVYGKGFTKAGNVEPYLSYSKLHRTGRLLRSIKGKHSPTQVKLYSNVPYAGAHDNGGVYGKPKAITEPYVMNGAKAVITGEQMVARPFMKPSKRVLRAPYTFVGARMRRYGW